MGSGFPCSRSGGPSLAAVHGGSGSEAPPQADTKGQGRRGDHEQPVGRAEGQPAHSLAAEKHQPESWPGGGLRFREVKLYPQGLSLGLVQLEIERIQG